MTENGPAGSSSHQQHLAQAREEARSYREAYEILGAAFTEAALGQQVIEARRTAFDDARLVRLHGPQDLLCYDYWERAGASVEQGPAGAVFVTPAQAWHYAAGVPLDFSGVDFDRQDCWIRVRLSEVNGRLGIGLYDADRDALAEHKMLDGANGVQEALLRAGDAAARLLLLRTGQDDAAAKGLFMAAEIVVADKPPGAQTDVSSEGVAAPSVPRPWRDRIKPRLQREALRAIDRLAPILLRHGEALERRLILPWARLASAWRGRFGTPRTLWGVSPILTLRLLAQCDRLLGLNSDSVVYTTYVTTSAFDINLKRPLDWLWTHRQNWRAPAESLILRLALLRFDVFHYFCDRGLSPSTRTGLNESELSLIRGANHRLYAYAFGGDVRTRRRTLALGPRNVCVVCPSPTQRCICDDDRGDLNQKIIARHANAVVSMGDMLPYAPAGVWDLHYWPLDTGKIAYVGVDRLPDRPLRIGHAPNNGPVKGTGHLVAAIDRLRAEGRSIELLRVQNVPNSEVMRLFASCDIIADQFEVGFNGYTALEAMLLGKPVLCYLRDPSMVLDPEACPMINTWPESLYQTLKDCLDGRHDLEALGRRSRAYIEHFYSLEAVAARLGEMYLKTANFPPRIARRIRRRREALIARLPPLIQGAPPVPWAVVPGAHVFMADAAA